MDGDWTWIEHPVTHLRARIARSALAHYLRNGWTEASAPEPPPPPQPEAAPVAPAVTDNAAAYAEAPAEVPEVPAASQDVPPPGGQNETGE